MKEILWLKKLIIYISGNYYKDWWIIIDNKGNMVEKKCS